MKIAIATAVYHPMINGVAVFTHHLATGLAARGHQVLVLCPSQTGRPYTRTVDGVQVVYLKSHQFKFYPDQIHPTTPTKKLQGHHLPRFWYRHGFRVSLLPGLAIARALDRFQPDVVHIQVSDPIGLATSAYARRHRIPVITTEHNQPDVLTDPLHLPRFLKKPLTSFLSSYFLRRQNQSDFATMPTKQAIKNLIHAHGRGFTVPVAAVSNGVDLTHFRPGHPPKSFYQKYHLPEDAPIVLYVGRTDPEKKVNLILTAFAKAHPQIPHAHLVIVGDGVALSDLKKQARSLNLPQFIHFLGRVVPPDLYQLYQTGTVFATASEIETQGIVLVEAAATGLPLIAVDRGAVSEICIDRYNGFLCRPGSTDQISAAMVKILQDRRLYNQFSKHSFALANEHDFNHTLNQFINIYHKVQSR